MTYSIPLTMCPRRPSSITLLAILVLIGSASTAQAAEFYVAPDGQDGNPGTTERPFATFARAQKAVREARRSDADEAVTVWFRQGRYQLSEPIEFTHLDSGAAPERPVRYAAMKGATVEFSGGERIGNWQPDPEHQGVWRTQLADPEVYASGKKRFEQLFVNGRRAVRARTPNWWHFDRLTAIQEEPRREGSRVQQHTFTVEPAAIKSLQGLSDEELRDVQVLVFHKWDTTREWLVSADVDEGRFVTTGAKMKPHNPMAKGCLFYLENFASALDAPGEWFLDRKGQLFYHPLPGEDMTKAEVIAPRIESFVVFRGQGDDSQQQVRNIELDGLAFRHAEYRTPAEGLPPAQAAMNVDSTAILADGATDIVLRNCQVEHVGATGIWFRKACRDCTVSHCRLADLGAGGVRIGETRLAPEAERTAAISVDNCIIHSGGRSMPQAVGMWIGHSPRNRVTHCDIADFYYTAVSVGWRWGYDESGAKENQIEFNHLHHIGYRILSDMGGVYTLGPSPGTSVSNNRIHDIYATTYGGWGLYPDEGSTGIRFENNLVYNVKDAGFHQHYGKENLVRNNIFAFSQEGQIAVTRAEPHLSFTFERNIVYWDRGQLLGYGGWKSGVKVKFRDNLYWRVGGQPFDFAGKSWKEWREAGNDEGSIIADPKFFDPEHYDFRLQPDSPAPKIGFQPFDYSKAGVYGDEEWKALAQRTEFPEPLELPGK